MSRAELATLLDRHGADPARWPADAAAAAEALVAVDPAARAELDAARRVEDVLARVAAPAAVDAATVGRIMARASGERQRREAVVRFTPRFAFAGMSCLVLFLAVGIGLGLVVPAPVADPGDEIAVILMGDDVETLSGDML